MAGCGICSVSQSDLVFYDLTSTYFEGQGRRSWLGSVTAGWQAAPPPDSVGGSDDGGWPHCSYVFRGNRLDKTTVGEVVDDLKNGSS